MEQKYFFTNYTIKRKFTNETISRVQNYMLVNGFLSEGQKITPRLAGIFLILAGCTATNEDLQTLGRILPGLETNYPEPENLAFVMSFILSDELKATAIEELIFDRAGGRVIFKLMDGSQVLASTIPIPIKPHWKEPGTVTFKREELVSLASSLNDDIQVGEIAGK